MKRKEVIGDAEESEIKRPRRDDNSEEQVAPPVFFSIPTFRSELGKTDSLKYLRDFANYAEWGTSQNDVVMDYLKDGGSISEITSLLDLTAQGDLATAMPVFRAVFNILLKIQGEADEYKAAARQDAENLLSTFIPTFQAMLTLNSAKHRKVVLKLLAALITLEPNFARQILNWISLTSPQIEQLVESGPVRKAFIMFLMAFFVDGNVATFRPLLDKKGLLSSIIPNLKYDECDTTVLVLNVMTDKILLNAKLTKTVKLNLFNTQTIQCLFHLYDWIGPKGVTKGWKKRPRKNVVNDPESIGAVTAALNRLLNVLCTNRKHGIIFWDKGLGVTSQLNQLIMTALEGVVKPWKKSETCKLVIEILISCPDLIKACLSKWEGSFEPRQSEAWIQATNFLIQLLDGLDADQIVSGALEVLSPIQLQAALLGIIMNSSVTKHIKDAIASAQPVAIRVQGLAALTAITSVLNKSLTALQKASSFSATRKYLVNNLKTILPSVDEICGFWMVSNGDPIKNKYIVRFLLEVIKMDSSLFQDKSKLCQMFVDDVINSHTDVGLASEVLQMVCLLDASMLSADFKKFPTLLQVTFDLSSEGEKCVTPLGHMLRSTNLFTDQSAQLDVWLFSWKSVADATTRHIAQLLVQVIISTIDKNGKGRDLLPAYMDETTKSQNAWSVSQRQINSQFLTLLAFHLGCLGCDIPSDGHKLFACKLNKWLEGSIKKKVDLLEHQSTFMEWLLSEHDGDLEQADVVDCYSRFVITNHFLRTWLRKDAFHDIRKVKCQKAIESIKMACSQDTVRSSWQPGDLVIDAPPIALLRLLVVSLFSEPALVDAFCIYETSGGFSTWLKEIAFTLELTKDNKLRWLPKELLKELKKKLTQQVNMIIANNAENREITCDLRFWVYFLECTFDDMRSFLEQFCALSPDAIAMNSSLGLIVLSAIDALRFQTIPQSTLAAIVRSLCSIVFIPECHDHYHEALFTIFGNFALSALFVPKDFVAKIVCLDELTDNLIRALTLYAKTLNATELGDVIVNAAENINGRIAVPLIGLVAKKQACLDTADSNSSDVDLKFDFSKKMKIALPAISERSWPYIKLFLRGNNDAIFSEWTSIVNLFIREIGTAVGGAKKIAKSLKKKKSNCEVWPSLVSVLYAEEPQLVSKWLLTLIAPSSPSLWLRNAVTLQQVIQDEEFVKDFVVIRMSDEWRKFLKYTLRNLSRKSDPDRWKIVRIMTEKTWSEGANNVELASIFEKCTSHPEFIPVMLSSAPVKEELLGLLLAIVRLWPNVMLLNHVPLYLASYTASLSACDQTVLQILRHYEAHLGSLSKFEPFFWGQPAIAHYSMRNGGLTLWKQINMKHVLELIDMGKMLKTIAEFPIDRKLKENEIKLKTDTYDPAFLLPLFSKLLSPGAISYCLSFVHKGALSFTIAALSSRDVNVRSAAAVVLSRFYSHLQLIQQTKQKPVWLHVIDCIRFGLDNLSHSPVAGVVTVFWARCILEVTDPQAPLYCLHRLLLAKPCAHLQIVPEFITLFFSQDVNNSNQRKWILDVVRDGIRHEDDVVMLLKNPTLAGIILTYFSTSYATNDIKIIILEICEKIIRIGRECKGLLDEIGLDLWLRTIAREIRGNLIEPYKLLLQSAQRYQVKWQKIKGRMAQRVPPTFLGAAQLRLQTSIMSRRGKIIISSNVSE